MQFNPGDRVLLKSGGPLLTVRSVNEGYVICTWYNKEKENFVQTSFKEEELKIYNPDE